MEKGTMKNDFKRKEFWIKKNNNNKQYFLKIDNEWIEVTREVYLVCKRSYQKMYREILRDHNVLVHYENIDNIQRYIVDSDETDPLTDLIKNESIKVLYYAFEQLNKKEQSLIYDMFFEEMSYRQLSKKYNIPVATLQYQIKKILNKLKKYLIQK